jgi:hypothetical protein
MISCWHFDSLTATSLETPKNPQRISADTPAFFSSSPPRFVETLKMLTTEPFFTTLPGPARPYFPGGTFCEGAAHQASYEPKGQVDYLAQEK